MGDGMSDGVKRTKPPMSDKEFKEGLEAKAMQLADAIDEIKAATPKIHLIKGDCVQCIFSDDTRLMPGSYYTVESYTDGVEEGSRRTVMVSRLGCRPDEVEYGIWRFRIIRAGGVLLPDKELPELTPASKGLSVDRMKAIKKDLLGLANAPVPLFKIGDWVSINEGDYVEQVVGIHKNTTAHLGGDYVFECEDDHRWGVAALSKPTPEDWVRFAAKRYQEGITEGFANAKELLQRHIDGDYDD